ncbi:Guanine nucleotide-binding protein-like 1 [Balamuthia mandrillaris]
MGRAKPFGIRKKKEQLKAKREKKRLQKEQQQFPSTEERTRRQVKRAAVHAPVENKNKLRTVFEKETKAEVDKRKFASQKPLHRWKSRIAEDYFARQFISMPKRPAWNYNMSKQQLERNEQQYFEHWLDTIYKNYPQERLNWFEHNLEVWRQLWRVIERSDILVVVADARHPLFHFPPSLYKYVVEDHRKPIMLVLNKIDLVAEDILAAWVRYFEKRYPELKVVSFTSFPHDEGSTLGTDAEVEIEKKRKKRMRKKYRAVGKEGLIATWASFGVQRGNAVIRPPAPKQEDEEADHSSEYESDDDDELVIESPSYDRVLSDKNEGGEAEDSEEDKEQVNTEKKKQPAKQKQGKQQKASREVDTSDEDDWARADIKKERDRKRKERKKRAQQTRQQPGSQSKAGKQISADDEEVEEDEEETVNKHGRKKQAHQSKAKQQGGHAKQRQDHKKATQASKGQNKKHQNKQRVIDSEEEERPEEEESEEKEEEEHKHDGEEEEEEEEGEGEEEEEDEETRWEREQKRKKEQEAREMRELGIESTLEDDLDYADEATLREHLRNLNYVTVGMVGHPNVGKSSLINGLVGRKVVSTSSTPGHTKFLQTIFLTKDIRLCDCPGLTFPSVDMPRPLQV